MASGDSIRCSWPWLESSTCVAHAYQRTEQRTNDALGPASATVIGMEFVEIAWWKSEVPSANFETGFWQAAGVAVLFLYL